MSLLIVLAFLLGCVCVVRTCFYDLRIRRVYFMDVMGCILSLVVLFGALFSWQEAFLILIISLTLGGILALLLHTSHVAWMAPVDGIMLTWMIFCVGGFAPHRIWAVLHAHTHVLLQGSLGGVGGINGLFRTNIMQWMLMKHNHIWAHFSMMRVAFFFIILGTFLVFFHGLSRHMKAPFIACAWVALIICQIVFYQGWIL